jgi:hypothetical protein
MNSDEQISWKMLAAMCLLGAMVGGVFWVAWRNTARKGNVDPLLAQPRWDYSSARPAPPSPDLPTTPPPPAPPTKVP